MKFEIMPGLNGKVYCPGKEEARTKKHTCRGCFTCQQCSDDRCAVCVGNGSALQKPPVCITGRISGTRNKH